MRLTHAGSDTQIAALRSRFLWVHETISRFSSCYSVSWFRKLLTPLSKSASFHNYAHAHIYISYHLTSWGISYTISHALYPYWSAVHNQWAFLTSLSILILNLESQVITLVTYYHIILPSNKTSHIVDTRNNSTEHPTSLAFMMTYIHDSCAHAVLQFPLVTCIRSPTTRMQSLTVFLYILWP